MVVQRKNVEHNTLFVQCLDIELKFHSGTIRNIKNRVVYEVNKLYPNNLWTVIKVWR
jgi:hypothetical protein